MLDETKISYINLEKITLLKNRLGRTFIHMISVPEEENKTWERKLRYISRKLSKRKYLDQQIEMVHSVRENEYIIGQPTKHILIILLYFKNKETSEHSSKNIT